MKSTRTATMIAFAVASLLALTAGTISRAAGTKSVTISVESLIPGSTPAAIQQFNNQVAEFQKANPAIKVKSVQYQWTGPTFAAKLAAGTLPTVFTVPFTDDRALAHNGKLPARTIIIKALPYYGKYNKSVIAEGIGSKNQIVAVDGRYAQAPITTASSSRRRASTEKPPTTWAAVRADAKLTRRRPNGRLRRDGERRPPPAGSDDARLRPRWPHGDRDRTKAVATLSSPQTVTALASQDAALDRQLDGLNFDYGWSDINQALLPAQSACTSAAPTSTRTRVGEQHRPERLRRDDDPARPECEGRCARRRDAGGRAAEREPRREGSGSQWIDSSTCRISKTQAIRNARRSPRRQPVGVPKLPCSTRRSTS
jgi:hypothetical protein